MENENSNEILDELKKLNKSISEELEREKNERDLQATRDSEQAQISAEKVEQDQAKELEQNELAAARQKELIDSLKAIDEKLTPDSEALSTDDQLLSEIKTMNKNFDTLIAYQENGHQYQLNQQNLGTMTVSLLLVGVGAYIFTKFCGFVVSKITSMF